MWCLLVVLLSFEIHVGWEVPIVVCFVFSLFLDSQLWLIQSLVCAPPTLQAHALTARDPGEAAKQLANKSWQALQQMACAREHAVMRGVQVRGNLFCPAPPCAPPHPVPCYILCPASPVSLCTLC